MILTLQDMTPLEWQQAEFLAMVSHKLRAPLTTIMGSATMLWVFSTLDLAEKQLFFRIIDGQADHMLDLINDLLDVARIDTGMLFLTTESTVATVLVDRDRNEFLSGGGRNNLRIDLLPSLSLITADRRRIVRVLLNLLTNVACHSPETSAIRMSTARDGAHMPFSIADDGMGIAPECLTYLFCKLSGEEGQDGGGVGVRLGLAICKGIVVAPVGRIWTGSVGLGLGTQFTFTLPAVEEADNLMPARSPAGSRRRGTPAATSPGDGRRPPNAAVRAGRFVGGGLRRGCDGRTRQGLASNGTGPAPPGAAGWT